MPAFGAVVWRVGLFWLRALDRDVRDYLGHARVRLETCLLPGRHRGGQRVDQLITLHVGGVHLAELAQERGLHRLGRADPCAGGRTADRRGGQLDS